MDILQYVEAQSLWQCRNVSKQLRECAEDRTLISEALKHFTVGVQFSLGSGHRHHWYDIRGTVTFSFAHLNKLNPQYALFNAPLVHPSSYFERAMDRWKPMCARGVGESQEWRVQYGFEDEVRILKLPKTVMGGDEGIWVDWREMMNAYYHTPIPRRTTGIVNVAGYLTP